MRKIERVNLTELKAGKEYNNKNIKYFLFYYITMIIYLTLLEIILFQQYGQWLALIVGLSFLIIHNYFYMYICFKEYLLSIRENKNEDK